VAEKNEIQKQKDEEINSFKKRIDEMSSDFAEMLRDTLTKMQDRIEVANREWDADNQVSLMERMQQNMLGDKAMWHGLEDSREFWLYSDSLSGLKVKNSIVQTRVYSEVFSWKSEVFSSLLPLDTDLLNNK